MIASVATLCQETLQASLPAATEGAEGCCAMPKQPPPPREVLDLPSQQVPVVAAEAAACQRKALPCSASPCSACCGRGGRRPSVVSPPRQPPLVTAARWTQPGIPGRLLPAGAGLCCRCPFPGRAELALMAVLKDLVRGQTDHQGAGVPFLPAAGP